jgi:hypothetical protein
MLSDFRVPGGKTAQPVDKNSLWREVNIIKRKMCVKEISAQDLGFVGGPF